MESKISVVRETPYGIYVWLMPGGKVVQDEDKNIMCINAQEHDRKAIQAITEVAKSYGLEAGRPYFVPDAHKVSDEEYERQKERQAQGLIADPYDIGAWKDEERFRGKN